MMPAATNSRSMRDIACLGTRFTPQWSLDAAIGVPGRRSYAVSASIRRRAIHRMDSANSVFNCASFLAKPR